MFLVEMHICHVCADESSLAAKLLGAWAAGSQSLVLNISMDLGGFGAVEQLGALVLVCKWAWVLLSPMHFLDKKRNPAAPGEGSSAAPCLRPRDRRVESLDVSRRHARPCPRKR